MATTKSDPSQLRFNLTGEGPPAGEGPPGNGETPRGRGHTEGSENHQLGHQRTLETLLEASQSDYYVVCILGRNPANMQRVANQMQHVIGHGELNEVLPDAYRRAKVLVAADYAHGLQLLSEHGYHPVAGMVVDPEDKDAGQLADILNLVDKHRVTDLSREELTIAGNVDPQAVTAELNRIFVQHHTVKEQVRRDYSAQGLVLPSGLLPLQRIQEYNDNLEKQIDERATPALREEWTRRRQEEVVNTKRTEKRAAAEKPVPMSASPEEVQSAVQQLTRTEFPVLGQQDYTSRIGPMQPDSRRVEPQLGVLIDVILASTPAQSYRGIVTHLFQHATRGIIGLLPMGKEASPDEKFFFIKPISTAAEVETVFRQYPWLKERGIEILHQPLAYYHSDAWNTFVIVSSSPLLATTAEIAQQVRQLGQPYTDLYTTALINTGLDTLVMYKRAAETETDEQQRIRALHKYKATFLTGLDDLKAANGIAPPETTPESEISKLERRLQLESLVLFDDLSLWHPSLFGPIMDFKTYNHGNRMGIIRPTPEQVKSVLFGDASQPDEATVNNNMAATFGILEYAGRLGFVLEDYFHTVNSPDLNIGPAKRPKIFESFIRKLMPQATDADLAHIWPAYFTMELFKTVRKMQRTVHYMITNLAREEGEGERQENHRLYQQEYAHYKAWLTQTAAAAITFTHQYMEDPFTAQLEILGQLYSERNPQFPAHPETLPQIPRAFYSAHLALQRTLEDAPKMNLLRRLEVTL